MARNIQSIVLVMGLVVCSIMVLQVSSQSSGCPAASNVTFCPVWNALTSSCPNGSPAVTLPTLAQILITPLAALASAVVGIPLGALKILGNFMVAFGTALTNLANAATTTTAAPTAAPIQIQFKPLITQLAWPWG